MGVWDIKDPMKYVGIGIVRGGTCVQPEVLFQLERTDKLCGTKADAKLNAVVDARSYNGLKHTPLSDRGEAATMKADRSENEELGAHLF